MNIEIKKSKKPQKYENALELMEKRLSEINDGIKPELIWTLEHEEVYTAGTSFKENEILDNSIKIHKTNRGGKITYHGPGQLICYFVIDLRKRNKDIRKFINIIENSIIDTLSHFNIKTFADKKNIGIWYKKNSDIKKVGAIGIKVKKWIAYHGFSINVHTDIKKYDAIIPCGIKDKGVTTLKQIKDQDYKNLKKILIKNFILNLKN